ncbi:MAG: hypothetical protein AUK55_00545 [Syntrophobacteraceae bacterium CG2_30_61_12]|nr:MAG: hypothetical protein AUK55_00545 [Syntrophobacteraceae bacterium CG2_30_61_12]
MKILLTGATGFLGSRLATHLHRAGHSVCYLRRPQSVVAREVAHLPAYVVEPDGSGIREALTEVSPHVVVHLAAHYVAEHRFEDIEALVSSNILFGSYLLEAMRLAGAKHLVYAGTSWQHYEGAEYRPVNLYAATKQAFSTLADYYRDTTEMRILELHLYDLYGEGDTRPRLLNQLQSAADSGTELAMSMGEQRIHLVHVDDVSRGFAMACRQVRQQAAGERRVYRLPSLRSVSLQELVAAFSAVNPHLPARVAWGKRPYRAREVFLPWDGQEILPDWVPRIGLQEGLRWFRGCR